MKQVDNQRILAHLGGLVGCDTQNPPRQIGPEHAIFDYINKVLKAAGGFAIEITDHGDGRVTYLARRGEPDILFNVHLDTVPIGSNWTMPPLELTVIDQRAYGRGSCDIKGAAAILLTLAEQTTAPLAMLFSTDEEGASGCCIREFTSVLAPGAYQIVVVGEPTGCEAILAHRGYLSVLGQFSGEPGHSSEARTLADNALHQACRWANAAIDYATAHTDGICFNLGTVHGGSASNVIAAEANVHWSARLAPGGDTDAELYAITHLTDAASKLEWNARFAGPPLPAVGQGQQPGADFAKLHNIPIGEPVNFWTEASLFSAVGQPAIVLGPGHIEQAHTADEWVALEQLWQAAEIYQRLLEHSTKPVTKPATQPAGSY